MTETAMRLMASRLTKRTETMRPEYEKLVEEIEGMIWIRCGGPSSENERLACTILAHVATRLAEVTPEMAEAWQEAWRRGLGLRDNPSAQSDWRAMLAASPLTPGDERTET